MRFRFSKQRTQDSELEKFRFRIVFAAGAVVLAFSLLIGRFFYLQVIQRDYYTTRAEDNRISLVPIAPNRGVILDRNGTILARNYTAFTLEITPSKIDRLDETIEELGRLVEILPKDRRRFRKLLEESKSFESLPIRTRLSDEEVARFAANRYRFPGVEVKARLFRQYPLGSIASHAIGYINRINKTDLETIEKNEQEANYKGTDHIGKTGLEQKYEFQLHGQTGYEEVEIDAGGHAIRSLARTAPISGNNLTLTLDAKLQEITEKAFGDRRGALVAIEPSTGGILALVSTPTFDPNLFVDGIRSDEWDLLNNSPDRPMVNRALNGAYPPGSTFKPFMALAALEIGKRSPSQTIYDPGYFSFGGHTFRDDKKGGHGSVDMYKSIVHSCDTYYYMLANDMGIDNIARFMGSLGLGSRTGIDIEGESEGVLPSPEWKKRRFKRPDQQKWYAGETISIGIGQGYNAYTPIQLAQAIAAVANNGVLYRPHLVRYITDTKSGQKSLIEPEPLRTLHWKPQNVETIKNAMIGVNKEGTGARAFAGAEYVSGGKTGTAQLFSLKGADYRSGKLKQELRDHALFIAFAPADQPKIALAVLVENGGFGARSAAPIARMVIDYYLLGKLPQGPAKDEDSPEKVE
ncbi:penicillin-binding protein 2 [Propionivibrio sp.]|uniref:penicillin-binding protein 2 n=1 Tax=Propionivibrio sp. TaxID=2212460 RepID=UPI0025DDC780|nr:penicillin-binding protein 2 [Propionivibrio sp.]MBK7357078.1 penicillin-binding protein 2 [Propionivibrio sp.]MBK8401492.1 penicillin-binding protein 2 [Propionivibrio sp.]MBK8745109.1 penicillin-binding protein 2 [Propionivibrio sp.]MBK8894098.1 penicillin-binding protein 2 [Propionivibrio sp.]MBL0208915.1 penicillin-binding protein 2 [Propionivibrio sp.]